MSGQLLDGRIWRGVSQEDHGRTEIIINGTPQPLTTDRRRCVAKLACDFPLAVRNRNGNLLWRSRKRMHGDQRRVMIA